MCPKQPLVRSLMRRVAMASFAAIFMLGMVSFVTSPVAQAAPKIVHVPNCNAVYVAVAHNPLYPTTGKWVSQPVTWACGDGYVAVTLFIDWGDGTTAQWLCGLLCFGGTHTFSHTYKKQGTYQAGVVLAGGECDSSGCNSDEADFTAYVSNPCIGPPTYC